MYIVIPAPGKVKSLVKETCAAFETGIYLEIALLENGEIWSWVHDVYYYTHILKSLCLGTIGLIGIPFIVIRLVRTMKKKQQEN